VSVGDLRIIRSAKAWLQPGDVVIVLEIQENFAPSLHLCTVLRGEDVITGVPYSWLARESWDVHDVNQGG
jgi:hypothetical protein